MTVACSANVRLPVLGMCNHRTTLQTQTARPAVQPSKSVFGRLHSVQLPSVKSNRRDAQHTHIIRLDVSSDIPVSKNPAVHAVRLKNIGHLRLGLFQAGSCAHLRCLPTLLQVHISKVLQFLIEPLLANLKWRETSIPTTLPCGTCLDILHHKISNRKYRYQLDGDPQLPLPPRLRARCQTSTSTIFSVRSTWRLSGPPHPAHHAPGLQGFLHPSHCVGLDVQERMCRGLNSEAFLLGTWIDPDRDLLPLPRRRFPVQPNTEDPAPEERCRLAPFYPPPCAARRCRHQRHPVLAHHWNEGFCRCKPGTRNPCLHPIETSRPRGWGLGEHLQRRLPCHGKSAQLPSNGSIFRSYLSHSSLPLSLVRFALALLLLSSRPL